MLYYLINQIYFSNNNNKKMDTLVNPNLDQLKSNISKSSEKSEFTQKMSYNDHMNKNLNVTTVKNPDYICNQIPVKMCYNITNKVSKDQCLSYWNNCCKKPGK